MKKILLLLILSCVVFSGCGNTEKQKELKQPNEEISHQEEMTEEDIKQQYIKNKQFPFFLNKFKEEIGGMLEKKGNKNIFLENPEEIIETNNTYGENVELKTLTYKINDKSNLIIYQDAKNEGVYGIFFHINKKEIDETSLSEATSCMNSVLVAFEGENSKVVADELNYYNVTENDVNVSSGLADYSYIVEDEAIMFLISPLRF